MRKAVGLRVLIIEDEGSIATALQLKLKEEGCGAMIAPDGQAGVAAVTKGSFECILLDIMMPKMNGFEVLEFLKKKRIKIPVICLTNLAQQEDIDHAMSLGAQEYLIKSDVSLADVVKRVMKML